MTLCATSNGEKKHHKKARPGEIERSPGLATEILSTLI